jgi:signal transduction histidine kinase
MRDIARPGGLSLLATAEGGLLASSGGDLDALGLAHQGLLRSATDLHGALTRVLRGPDTEWLASAAPVGGLGWVAVVAQPSTAAFGPALRVRRYTAFWAAVALVLTGVLGALVARTLTGPVEKLKRSARALQEGRYDEPIEVQGRDELGELAQAFGHMAQEVRRRDVEIRAWNAELQQRVDERSAELKAAQDQILRTRRLAALGSLGGGVAHEINNPLMVIGGYLAILKKTAADQSAASTIEKAGEQVKRVAEIVDGLLQLSSQERAFSGRRFSLAEATLEVLAKRRGELQQAGIELSEQVECARDVEGDPVQIGQVIDHLVKNAIQAMPSGGNLSVSVLDVGGDSLKLTVADSGRGIPPSIRERIFDPFFSTKESGKPGVGLGLSISHSIVEAHHGRILVDSAEGCGSTFTVVLPAAAAPAHLS